MPAVIEHHIDIATADGEMNAYVVHPEEGGPHPVLFFYMDAPGKRQELHDMASRLATVGYFVVLPNLYYRWEREFSTYSGNPAHTRERMVELMNQLSDRMVGRDTQAMFDFVDAAAAADASRVGCLGYCMSGPFAFAMAGMFPDRIRAAASLYGVRLFGDKSPAHLADKIKGELYFACAEFDDYAPKEMIDGLEAHLRHAGVNFRAEWYPGAHHGFAFPGRAGAYDRASAERHWERLFALFRRNLS